MKKTAMLGLALATLSVSSEARSAASATLEFPVHPFSRPELQPAQLARGIAKGVPPAAYTGGRGPIKRNKSARHHAKRAARIARR